jgi:uncharacterized protein
MILKVILVLVGLYACLLVLLYLVQAKLIFFPTGDLPVSPADYGWAFEDVLVNVGSDTTHGWLIQADESRGTVLFSHGNAGTIAYRLDSAAVFRDLGFNVLLYDYGGYGRSTGSPTEKRCNADVRAMWSHLTEERGTEPERVVLFGRSLGSGPTIDLAAEVEPGALIIENAFLSAVHMARRSLPIVPAGLLLQHRFENDKKIGQVRAPVLAIHSPEDEIVPYAHGQALYELASEPKQFLEIRGDHNSGFMVSGELYVDGLKGFLDPLFPARQAQP